MKSFEEKKKRIVDENEAKYGAEIRAKYGDDAIDNTNKRIMNMSEKGFDRAEDLRVRINEKLKAAIENGDPASAVAQEACELHREWLCIYWGKEKYNKAAHLGLAQMYTEDERFREYYGAVSDGAAEFLLSAMKIYCKE